jgi:hypothetical protein
MNINNPKILEEDPNFRDIGLNVEVFRKKYKSEKLGFTTFPNDRGLYTLHKFTIKISPDPLASRQIRFKSLHESFKVNRMIEKILQLLKKKIDPVSYSMMKTHVERKHSPIITTYYTVPGFFQLYGLDVRQTNQKFKKIAYDSVDINRENDLFIEFVGDDTLVKTKNVFIIFSMYENDYTSSLLHGLESAKLDHPLFYLEELINNSKRMVKLATLVDSMYNLIRQEAKEAAKSIDIVGMKTVQHIPEARTLIQNFAYGKSKREEDIDRSREATARNTERSRKKYLIKEYKKYSRRPRPPLNALQQVKKDYSKPRSLAER